MEYIREARKKPMYIQAHELQQRWRLGEKGEDIKQKTKQSRAS